MSRASLSLIIVVMLIGTAFTGGATAAGSPERAHAVLLISPHPDDGEIFAGGTMCDHLARGDRVIEVFVTSGGAGMDPQGRTSEELAGAREDEAGRATSVIGMSGIVFLRFPDGGVQCNETTLDAIKDRIEEYHPYAIYTSEFVNPYYSHPDHVNTGKMVYDAVEALDWREKPIIRFFDYIPRRNGPSSYTNIAPYIRTKMSAVMKHESQMGRIMAAVLPVLGGIDALLAHRLGLYEGFREVKLAPGQSRIYDFEGACNPSSTNMAWYKNTERAPDNNPPGSGPRVDDSVEFTARMYMAIQDSDNIRAETNAHLWKRLQNFRFVLEEDPSDISELYVRWEGYGTPAKPRMYIWNFGDGAWEDAGSLNGNGEGIIERTYTESLSDYVGEHGCLYLAVISQTDEKIRNDNQIDTDYIKVRVNVR